jgi:hypothetical protein
MGNCGTGLASWALLNPLRSGPSQGSGDSIALCKDFSPSTGFCVVMVGRRKGLTPGQGMKSNMPKCHLSPSQILPTSRLSSHLTWIGSWEFQHPWLGNKAHFRQHILGVRLSPSISFCVEWRTRAAEGIPLFRWGWFWVGNQQGGWLGGGAAQKPVHSWAQACRTDITTSMIMHGHGWWHLCGHHGALPGFKTFLCVFRE